MNKDAFYLLEITLLILCFLFFSGHGVKGKCCQGISHSTMGQHTWGWHREGEGQRVGGPLQYTAL